MELNEKKENFTLEKIINNLKIKDFNLYMTFCMKGYISSFHFRTNSVSKYYVYHFSERTPLSIDEYINLIKISKEKSKRKDYYFILEVNKDLNCFKRYIEEFYPKDYTIEEEGDKIIIDYHNIRSSEKDHLIIKKQFGAFGLPLYTLIERNIANREKEEFEALPKIGITEIKTSTYKRNYKDFENIDLAIIPRTQAELNEFGRCYISTIGEVIEQEQKKTKNGKDISIFKITSYQETLTVRVFSNLTLKIGSVYEFKGKISYDEFNKEVSMMSEAKNIQILENESFIKEKDLDGLFKPEEKERVELHVHTTMSTQDGLTTVEEYFQNAKNFGIKALAVTDHENVQAYPEVEAMSKKYGIKPIYGVELNVIDDKNYKIYYNRSSKSPSRFVALDIETTGFSGVYDRVIEIGAYDIFDESKTFNCLVRLDDDGRLTSKIKDLTGITLDDLKKNGIDIKDALEQFIEFSKDSILIAHNANFDIPFIENQIAKYLSKKVKFSYIDTLSFSRVLLKDEMKRFKLDAVAKKLKIKLENHHRATDDAICCGEIFKELIKKISRSEVIDGEENHYIVKTSSKKAREAFISYATLLGLKYDETTNESGKISRFHFVTKNFDAKEFNLESSYHENSDIINKPEELNKLITQEDILNGSHPTHMTVLVKNQKGLKELFKLISLCHLERITNFGIMTFLSDLTDNKELRENILIGSSCECGMFADVFEKGFSYIDYVNNYDYFEIQPMDCYLSVSDSPNKKEYIKTTVKTIVDYARRHNKLYVASTDSHYIYPAYKTLRDVYINTICVGGGMHPLYNKESGTHILLSTSNLESVLKFNYNFSDETINNLVFTNPNLISDKIEDIKVVSTELNTPKDDFLKGKVLDIIGHEVVNVKDEFESIVYNEVKKYEIDGVIPDYVKTRLDKEMNSIVGHGFHIIYYIAYLLVKKSNSDGYVVGSRGSVGSSFVANLLNITEVNALAPHYRCPKCHYQIYKGVKDLFNVNDKDLRHNVESVEDGFDLKEATCPCCGERLVRDGHDIPFETFLGFNGDKTPDIDLNFSGEYQPVAHNFCKTVFGENYAFRAGTVSTVAEKTAFNFMSNYLKKIGIDLSNAEITRRAHLIENVKRTTGQHPAGIIVVPNDKSIYDFTPIQYPANQKGEWKTTHFDYHGTLDNALLKLDILGHDDPTMLKMLMDIVRDNPSDYPFTDIKDIPLVDKDVFAFLQPTTYGDPSTVSSFGISELGTKFVRGMLAEISPKSFAQLVQVSGLSHGEDVWENNAQKLVAGTSEFGKIDFGDTISCRDDIMVQLIRYGLKESDAFKIMEFVRKGKVHKEPEAWVELKAKMVEHNVPNWYIYSCEQIKYMFPKAHAVAYVLSAMRIAWFKAHRPLDFYQAYFSIRAEGAFDAKVISSNDPVRIQEEITAINNNKETTQVDKNKITYFEVAIEMLNRGLRFAIPDVNKSHYKNFTKLDNNTILMPFSVIDGVGEAVAKSIYDNRLETPYTSIDDLKQRGKANKTFLEKGQELGVFEALGN